MTAGITGTELEAICQQARPWLVSVLRGLGASEHDAEDAAQDALLALWRNRAVVRHPFGYLRTVGVRKLPEFSRAWQKAALVPDADRCADPPAASSRHGADLAWEALPAQLVRQALLTLPPRQREVLACRYDGYPNTEIARALGQQEVTVRTNCCHARRNLRTLIEATGWDLRPHVLQRAYQEMRAGNLTPAGTRPAIAQSWARSEQHQVDPGRGTLADVLNGGDLELLRNASPLRALLPTVGTRLFDIADRNSLMATVSGASGRVLWRGGNDRVLRREDRDKFCEGSEWTEKTAGTNANGVALQTGFPAVVITAEHFCEFEHYLICAAAPIHARNGQLLGVLNLTARWPTPHKDMLRFIEAAARQAQRQLTPPTR